jgi:hypothetical protein
LSSSRRTFAGTRNRIVPSRAPNRRIGSVSHGTLAVGSTESDRNDPPRWALTANRKSVGVAASHASTFSGFGCW